MVNKAKIDLSLPKITEFCQRNHIRNLSLAGASVWGELKPDSEVNLLAEFDPEHVPGFVRLAGMEIELTIILRHKVDLKTTDN